MAEQYFQIGVKGLIRNAEGKILMVRIPAWGGNSAGWDLPGGRMAPGEDFLDTLARELQEEIGTTYVGTPKQFDVMLSKVTIPVGKERLPLVFVVYEAAIASNIMLDPNSSEEAFEWFAPARAAQNMATKFTQQFCDRVAALT